MLQVSSRIWEDAVVSLHALREPSALTAWLPSNQPDGKAGAAAALLGNLAQVSASALQVSLRTHTASGANRDSMPTKKATLMHCSFWHHRSVQPRHAELFGPMTAKSRHILRVLVGFLQFCQPF